jgi:tetratricopeptide (TPR) repeat protein
MRRLAAVLLACALFAGRAFCGESAETLYSRGLVEFHAGRYEQALKLFDQAVETDSEDAQARYYRGVTRGRLEDFAGAVADLRAVAESKPKMDQVLLELGVALVQAGNYPEAVSWLKRAQSVPRLLARASLFLGLARLRLGETDAARDTLSRADGDPELRLAARYYQGIAAFQAKDWQSAEGHFSFVAASSPDSAMGKEASRFLEKLRQPAAADDVMEFYAALGFDYDSNVVLAPSDDVVKDAAGISNQADGRATILAGGTYIPWQSERARLSLGYEFYQSLHFQLEDFNLQDHRPSAHLSFDLDWLRLGTLARYDYYLLSDDSFLQEVTALPWVEVPEGDFGRTELSYRMRWRDFLLEPFKGVRDGFNHAPGIRQFIYLPSRDRYVAIGYRFDREDPTTEDALDSQFAYDGHEVQAAVGWAVAPSLVPGPWQAANAEIGYAYRDECYAEESNGRRDEAHQLIAALDSQLYDHFHVTLAYLGVFNDSNDARYEYDRHIVSLSLGVRF